MQPTQPTEQAESEDAQGQPIHVWRPYPQFTDEVRAALLAGDPVVTQQVVDFMKALLQ